MKVLMACAGGMSSSFIAKAIEKEGKTRTDDFSVVAIADTRIKEYIEKSEYDIIILAPQIRFKYPDVCKLVEGKAISVLTIEGRLYTPMGAPKLVDLMEQKLADDQK